MGSAPLMPPKLRRPAAVAKAAPHRRGVRRPASRKDGFEEEPEVVFRSADLTLAECRGLKDIVTLNGTYWEAPAQAALRVQEMFVREQDSYLRAEVLGTQSEQLLRMASERKDRVIEVHLWCTCAQRVAQGGRMRKEFCM